MSSPRKKPHYLDELRTFAFHEFTRGSWSDLHKLLASIGITWTDRGTLGKEKYTKRELAASSDGELHKIASWFAANPERFPNAPDFQDAAYWIEAGGNKLITDVTRQRILDILDGIDLTGRLTLDDFGDLVGRRPGSSTIKFTKAGAQLFRTDECENAFKEGELADARPVPRPIANRDFLLEFGLMGWPDLRVAALLEAVLAPTSRGAEEQNIILTALDAAIVRDGHRLEISEYISERPVYKLVRIEPGVSSTPKNVIFAAVGPKPEILFRDAVSNDIIIVQHGDGCLVYDRPIDTSGVSWVQLLDWWQKAPAFASHSEPWESLRDRLLACLQSEPEVLLFTTYFDATRQRNFPALFPQVYLHYDPRTARELRGELRIPRQRMDFLLLLPHGVRIVIEIDGRHHYSVESGAASPPKYAEMVREDRKLRLSGYEIYRFGGQEFIAKDGGKGAVRDFFRKLFLRHGLKGRKSA